MNNYFLHPKSVGMTYTEHFCFSIKLSYFFLSGFFKSVVHAFYPDICITSSSDYSKLIYETIHNTRSHSIYNNNELCDNCKLIYKNKNNNNENVDLLHCLHPTDVYRSCGICSEPNSPVSNISIPIQKKEN